MSLPGLKQWWTGQQVGQHLINSSTKWPQDFLEWQQLSSKSQYRLPAQSTQAQRPILQFVFWGLVCHVEVLEPFPELDVLQKDLYHTQILQEATPCWHRLERAAQAIVTHMESPCYAQGIGALAKIKQWEVRVHVIRFRQQRLRWQRLRWQRLRLPRPKLPCFDSDSWIQTTPKPKPEAEAPKFQNHIWWRWTHESWNANLRNCIVSIGRWTNASQIYIQHWGFGGLRRLQDFRFQISGQWPSSQLQMANHPSLIECVNCEHVTLTLTHGKHMIWNFISKKQKPQWSRWNHIPFKLIESSPVQSSKSIIVYISIYIDLWLQAKAQQIRIRPKVHLAVRLHQFRSRSVQDLFPFSLNRFDVHPRSFRQPILTAWRKEVESNVKNSKFPCSSSSHCSASAMPNKLSESTYLALVSGTWIATSDHLTSKWKIYLKCVSGKSNAIIVAMVGCIWDGLRVWDWQLISIWPFIIVYFFQLQ